MTRTPTSADMRARPSTLALATLAVGSIMVTLLLIELLLRVAGPRERSYHVLRPNLDAQFAPQTEYLRGISPTAHYRTNSLGMRGAELPADSSAFRILVVGGSTTENVYLDDARTWPHLLEQNLDSLAAGRAVWVGAAGRSGMNSRDHVLHVRRLLEQLPRIDHLLVLVGVNDLTVALSQGDTFRVPPPLADQEAERAQEARAFAIIPGGLHDARRDQAGAPWYKRTALWQLGRTTSERFVASRVKNELQQDNRGLTLERWRERRRDALGLRTQLPPLDAALTDYRANLRAIVEHARSHSTPISFLTQPAIWRADLDSASKRLLWLGGVGEFQRGPRTEYYSPAVLADAMAAYNAAMLATCSDQAVQCFDLATMVPRDTMHFFDDVHFTELASQVIADAVSGWLRTTLRR